MWENTYQIVYDSYIQDGENPRKSVSVEIPINEGAKLGYMVVNFDYGIEDGSGVALMKCIGCEAVDMGRAPQCSIHGHRKQ